mmetsp:Transcript_35091/g.78603  ORF Transcript_35091/g.78603 Transcript_35091/m.78603 type:complete len:243 (+) Transcript_35091:52-780(+)
MIRRIIYIVICLSRYHLKDINVFLLQNCTANPANPELRGSSLRRRWGPSGAAQHLPLLSKGPQPRQHPGGRRPLLVPGAAAHEGVDGGVLHALVHLLADLHPQGLQVPVRERRHPRVLRPLARQLGLVLDGAGGRRVALPLHLHAPLAGQLRHLHRLLPLQPLLLDLFLGKEQLRLLLVPLQVLPGDGDGLAGLGLRPTLGRVEVGHELLLLQFSFGREANALRPQPLLAAELALQVLEKGL